MCVCVYIHTCIHTYIHTYTQHGASTVQEAWNLLNNQNGNAAQKPAPGLQQHDKFGAARPHNLAHGIAKEKDRGLNADELRNRMQRLGLEVSETQAMRWIVQHDSNKDGRIGFES